MNAVSLRPMAPFRLADGAWLNTPGEQVSLVQPVSVAVNNANAAASQEELSFRLNQIELGQQMVAQVQNKLSDGSFLVRVADTVTQMHLPANVQTGDTISITLIEKSPRPTFLFNGETPTALTGSSVMSLSNTGRLISNLMAGTPENAPPLTTTLPVSGQPPVSPSLFAQALQQTVSQSGLFYEAHLQEWAQGRLPLSNLRQEPQAQLDQQLPAPPAPVPVASTSSPAPAANMPTTTTSVLATTATSDQASAAINSSSAGQAASVAGTTLQHLVQTQLQTLEQNRFVWQGNLWPGQTAEWEVAQDQHQAGTSAIPQQAWTSRLRLTLPTLGDLTADLRLQNGHLQVRLQSPSPATINRLQNGQSGLVQGLEAAGLRLDSLLVEAPTPAEIKG